MKTNPIMPHGWKYHFNASFNGDSRLTIAVDCLLKACADFKEATSENKRKKALKQLGVGLHALQDYSAHGNFWPVEEVRSTGNVSYIINAHSYEYDDPYFDWVGSQRDSFSKKKESLGERYNETKKNTILYVILFLIGIEEEIEKVVVT